MTSRLALGLHWTFGPHGVMVTASNLVFSGDWSGAFNAFDARTGQSLSDGIPAG